MCCHSRWEKAVAVLALLYVAPLPSMLHFTSLPHSSFIYLQMSSEGMSDIAQLYFLLQDYKLLVWKKIPPLLPNPLPRIHAIGSCLSVFQLCMLVSLNSWFHSHVLALLS